MNLNFTQKLYIYIQKISIGAQKIDGSTLKTFKKVINNFQIKDKANRSRFFQETFLVANTKFEIILKIFFLKFNNINMIFDKKKLI